MTDEPMTKPKKMTVVIADDPGPALADADIMALKSETTSKVVRTMASELYLSQLRLLVSKEPELAKDIEIFWIDALGEQHLIGLGQDNEARWPAGFLTKSWEIEIQITRYHRQAKGFDESLDPTNTNLSDAYARIAAMAERIVSLTRQEERLSAPRKCKCGTPLSDDCENCRHPWQT